MPSTDSNVEVYSNQSTLGDYTLDITGIAQEWLHNGVNNGLMLKAENETTYVYSYWSSDSTANQPPIVRFQYSDYAGLESSLSYHDIDLAKGAALHVSDFNGNMVVTVPVVETQGNLLPVNLDLVYNSTLRNINVPDLMTGDGWRTTYDRTITWMVINGVEYYRYRDGDGTEHFFYSNGTNWVDEDGLGLTFDQTTLTITDLQDNKIAFYTGATANGRLKEIVDAQGNKVSVTQTASGSTWCVTAVTDAAGRQTTYNRATDGTLQSITDPAGRATSLGYTGSKLTTITYPDNKTLVVAYDANGNLTTLDDADGVRRSLTYQSTTPYRVTQVSEAATNGSATGGYLNFAYSRNMTSVTDHLGKTTSYQFNNKGDCLCVIAPDGSAGFANYNDGGRLTHTASQVSNPQKFTANLLVNHSAEQSSTWTFSAANGTAGYATDKKFQGNQSIKLYKTSATGQNSATQTVTLEKGKTYTLSAFASTDTVGTGGLGAGLAAAYESSAGVFTPINGRSLRGTQDFILESLIFTVPSNAYSGTVKLQAILDGTTGTAWFDCLQLETDKVANRYNIISNSDFDQTSIACQWTGPARHPVAARISSSIAPAPANRPIRA